MKTITMNNLNAKIKVLLKSQLAEWELARTNFEGLKTIKTKIFNFNDFDVKVQFNTARIMSSGAKVDAQSIANRQCFLCEINRPVEQISIDAGEYEILINPFPIFPEHFTIPRKEHVNQQILPYFSDMLELAKSLDDYLIFYNGPQCGASAPDHMHFQAGTKDFLPLVNDYKRLKISHTDLLVTTETMQLFQMKNYMRTVYCIESSSIRSAKDAFEKLYAHFESTTNTSSVDKMVTVEPLMNIVCLFENGKWSVFVLPRKAFRPWQYTAEGDKQLLVSPATVEMCGVFIAPIVSHFDRITKADVQSIFEQCSLVIH